MTAGSSDAAGGDSPGDGSRSRNGGGSSEQVSTAETVVMVLSVAFTVALFGFALWQALTGPGALAPTVTVVGDNQAPNGEVLFTVELRNPGDLGLVSATVEAECTDPPAEIVFENVPADGRRRGTVVCPPETDDPNVSVASWVQE